MSEGNAMDYDIKLIEVVKKYPELYDSSHRNFKNKEVKAACWKDVAFKMRKQSDEYSVKVVRMRWKSLRDSYVKEIKYKMAVSTGHSVKPRKNWRYSNRMTFLAPFLSISFPLPPGRPQQDESNHPEEEPDGHFLGALLDFSKHNENGDDRDDFARDFPDKNPQESVSSSTNANTISNNNTNQVSGESGSDDVDSFFKGIAEAVKKMNVVNQVFIQRNIVNMILDFKLREAQEKFIIEQREVDDDDDD